MKVVVDKGNKKQTTYSNKSGEIKTNYTSKNSTLHKLSNNIFPT